jgi:hypothetical protein
MGGMLKMRLWDDIPVKYRPDQDDLLMLDGILDKVIEIIKMYFDFDVAQSRSQGERRLGGNASRYGRTASGANAVEWGREVLNLRSRTLLLIARLKNAELTDLLIHRAMPLFSEIVGMIVPGGSRKVRQLRGPHSLLDKILPARPDTLIRSMLLPQERLLPRPEEFDWSKNRQP